MEFDEFVRHSATKEGNSLLHTLIENKCEWLFHDTEKEHLTSICNEGLLPRNPGAQCPETMLDAFGTTAETLLCFAPRKSGMVIGGHIDRQTTKISLAVHRDKFPHSVAIDWSFGRIEDLLGWRVKQASDFATAASIAVEWFIAHDDIVFLDGVPASHLRICIEPAVQDPANWPPLREWCLSQE